MDDTRTASDSRNIKRTTTIPLKLVQKKPPINIRNQHQIVLTGEIDLTTENMEQHVNEEKPDL